MKGKVLWALAGRGGYAAVQWLVLALIAHRADVHMLGYYSYAVALVSPVIMFSQLNMRAIQVVDVREEIAFSPYLAARWIATLLAISCMAVIAWLHRDEPDLVAILGAVTAMKALESVADLYLGVLVRQENQRRMALSTLLRSASWLIFVVAGLIFAHNLLLGLWLAALAWGLQLLFYDRRIEARRAPVQYRQVLQLMWQSLPFGLVMAAATLTIYLPIYATKMLRGTVEVGYLSTLLVFFSLGRMVLTTVTEVYLPRLSHAFLNANYDRLWQLTRHLLGASLLWGIGGVAFVYLFGDLLLTLCYGQNFKGLAPALVWIMIAALISYIPQVFFSLLTLARLGWEQLAIYLGVAAVCAASAAWLIAREGVPGAGKTLCITMLAMTALVWLALRVKMPQIFNYRPHRGGDSTEAMVSNPDFSKDGCP